MRRTDDIAAYFDLAREGENVEADLRREMDALRELVDRLETETLLSGENDARNAIVTIHPGAGGTESQDWAEMLMRMYLRWAERQGFQTVLYDYQPGEEAGIKSATFGVNGEYAFGLLTSEIGVHRLVRISPFDQAKRRHTSFASVFVSPEIDESIEVDHQAGRHSHRHLPLQRQGRTARQYHRLRRAHHAHSHRTGGQLARTSARSTRIKNAP